MATVGSARNLQEKLGGATMDPEEELQDLKKRFHLLEGDRKAYYETSQWTMRQNKETIAAYRRDNKELRQTLANLQKQESNRLKANDALNTEMMKLDTQVLEMRKRFDLLRSVGKGKEDELSQLQDQLRDLQLMSVKSGAEDNPQTRRIRQLENRLDKAMIKYNEAQSIRKTYEQIVKRLQEERLGFDNQLAAIERTLKAKEHDYEELLMMSRDALHAKEVARAELQRFEQTIEDERKQRERELHERRQVVKTKVEINERMEKRQKQRDGPEGSGNRRDDRDDDLAPAPSSSTPATQTNKKSPFADRHSEEDHERKITTYEEAFRKIKEATGVSDINEVIQKFLTQEETHNNLFSLKQEAQTRVESLGEEKLQLKAKVEEIKYSGTGSLGSRRIVDEFEAHLTEANTKCERNRHKYERIAKILINVKAGIGHLGDKLEFVKVDAPNLPISDDTVAEVLTHCETKLCKLLDLVVDEEGRLPGVEELRAQVSAEAVGKERKTNDTDLQPQYNVRIRLPDDDGPEDLEDDVEADDLLDRQSMKQVSAQITERATKKKAKKGRRRGKEGDDVAARGARSVSAKGRDFD